MNTKLSPAQQRLGLAIAMAIIIAASNVLYSYPIGPWLTWGAFSYPFSFLVTDLANRTQGAAIARRAVVIGFAIAVPLSFVLAGWRIAIASGTAFLIAQILDIWIFSRLREAAWWRAPLISSAIASLVDSTLFFSIAFAFTDVPWITLAAGDQCIKWIMAFGALPIYYAFVRPSASQNQTLD